MRVLCSFVLALAVTASAAAQTPPQQLPPQPPPGAAPPLPQGPEAGITAGQIQRWFEAFTVLQAQEALQLSEAQYGRFVTRLKALQDTRRRHQQARNQMLATLRQLTNERAGGADESAIADRLRELREEEERFAADLRKAYAAVDEALDTRQQARFRLFEERMEQQKLELLMRARQNARQSRGRVK